MIWLILAIVLMAVLLSVPVTLRIITLICQVGALLGAIGLMLWGITELPAITGGLIGPTAANVIAIKIGLITAALIFTGGKVK